MKKLKPIITVLLIIVLMFIGTYSGITMYLLSNTRLYCDTIQGIELYYTCQVLLLLSASILFLIWMIDEFLYSLFE